MFDDVIDWFRGLFGGVAEETVAGAADAAQAFGEEVVGGAAESAQGFGEEILGGAAGVTEGFREQADAVGGVLEDPGGAATDAARDRLFGEDV